MKNTLPFKFDDCIFSTSPLNKGEEDFISIYPGSDEFKSHIIFDGYFKAADYIIKSMYKDQSIANPSDDQFAIPLLSIYINVLEFCLKILITRLKNHKLSKTCNVIKDSTKIEMNHNLTSLGEKLKEILPEENKIHNFFGFDEIFIFIEKIYKYGVNSESCRFPKSKKNRAHDLHLKRTNICPRKLHDNMEYIVYRVSSYLQNEDFTLCESNRFQPKTISELKYVKSIMLENKAIIFRYNSEILIAENKKPSFIKVDIEKVINEIKLRDDFFDQFLKTLDHKKLAAMVLGLYCNHPLSTIPNLDTIEKWRHDELKQKFFERLHLYNLCYKKLKKHISYVENIFKNQMLN